jgi:hypothetical protein
VIDEAAPHDGDGFEAPMGMLWETGDHVTVIHVPAIFAGKVLTDVAPSQGRHGPEVGIAEWVVIFVVRAEQERIARRP